MAASERMFSKIISDPNAFFKHQQRDEPDLSDAEKLSVLEELFRVNPRLFLARYSAQLSAEDVVFFDKSDDDPEMGHYLKQMEFRKGKIVRNRRYSALREMMKADSEFFSDPEMKVRAPLLYQQMIGRHLSADEMEEIFMVGSHSSRPMSEMFLAFVDNQRTAEVQRAEELLEDTCDLSLDDEEENEEVDDEFDEKSSSPISDAEKQRQREEFLALMHERFLAGKDAEFFDYSNVDNNPAFDPIDLIARDAEDSYFDSEEPN